MHDKNVIIIGAGPAGLTAGYELIKKGYLVTILEQDPEYVGGISRTVRYKNYRFDIGGHRFFSKNEEVMKWWDDVMGENFLLRSRISRWYYRGKFFNYPINIFEILYKFGPYFAFRIFSDYLYRKIFPIKSKDNLEVWFKNNFGDYLAKPFFIDYNYKLWGIPCSELSKDFALQRIKGISLKEVIVSFCNKILKKKRDVKSFINEFHYPKYGPGELWERVEHLIIQKGGKVLKGHKVIKVNIKDKIVKSVDIDNKKSKFNMQGDIFLSTMPYNELVCSINPCVSKKIQDSAGKLKFRDFITIALVINNPDICPDNWVYTHDKGMRPIRFQNFKNWSPFMVPDKNLTVIGLEYVCNYNDSFWSKSDEELIQIGKEDFSKLKFASSKDIIDSTVVRMKNVYPIYDKDYKKNVDIIKEYLDHIHNLYPLGRGGIHKYNNSDHSMMTAFLTVKNIIEGNKKYDVFKVNIDAEYHEEINK